MTINGFCHRSPHLTCSTPLHQTCAARMNIGEVIVIYLLLNLSKKKKHAAMGFGTRVSSMDHSKRIDTLSWK